MAVFYLPVGNSDSDQTTTFTLDNERYDFRVRYNQREANSSATSTPYDGWRLYIGLAGQPPFIETPLKTSRDLLLPHRYKENCPSGRLFLADITAVVATEDPNYNYSPERVGFETLGRRYQLVYIDNT